MSEFDRHKAHFGPISQEIINYVNNEILLSSRYLFTKYTMRMQYAYCTHCNQWHKPDEPLKHNSKAECPKCNSICVVKKSHVGRKYMVDHAYVVYYQKSILDPKIMTAIGLYVKRDYSGDFKNLQTSYSPSCSYVFEMGQSTMFYGSSYSDKWYQRSNIISEYSHYLNGTPCHYSRESIKSAIVGTPFQYSTWEEYDENDMTKFFGLYSKYPCIEYLTKMKYEYFVYAKLLGGNTFNAINWSGKTVNQILKMDKQDLRQFKKQFPRISWNWRGENVQKALSLRVYQITRKDNNRPSLENVENVANDINGYFTKIKPMLKYQNLMYCIRYVNRQFGSQLTNKVYSTKLDVLITWKDYIADCVKLGFDLNRENIVFPHDLHAAHEKTILQVEIKVSREAAKKIRKRVKELEKFKFSFNGYFIRPALSAKEIIEEGKALRHCAGGYAKDYANGVTNILMIRKYGDPETPYYTMEVKGGKIIQTQGFRHCIPKADIAELVEEFKRQKLKIKQSKSKSKNKPEIRQEVAV